MATRKETSERKLSEPHQVSPRTQKPEKARNGNRRNGADGTRLSRHMRLDCIPVCFRQKHVHPEAQTPKKQAEEHNKVLLCNGQYIDLYNRVMKL